MGAACLTSVNRYRKCYVILLTAKQLTVISQFLPETCFGGASSSAQAAGFVVSRVTLTCRFGVRPSWDLELLAMIS